MTIDHKDEDLDQALRLHYHAILDGVTAPEQLRRQVLTCTEPQQGSMARWAPVLAVALAGASFLVVLASSRMAEIVFRF